MIRNLLATTAIAALMTTGAVAQTTDPATGTGATTAPAQEVPMVKHADGNLASELIGERVYNGTGDDAQNIGKVNDLVLDPEGNVQAIVVGVGGFLGIGEKEVALEFDLVEWAERDGDQWLVVETSKEALEAQEEFDRAAYQPMPADAEVSETKPATAEDLAAAPAAEGEEGAAMEEPASEDTAAADGEQAGSEDMAASEEPASGEDMAATEEPASGAAAEGEQAGSEDMAATEEPASGEDTAATEEPASGEETAAADSEQPAEEDTAALQEEPAAEEEAAQAEGEGQAASEDMAAADEEQPASEDTAAAGAEGADETQTAAIDRSNLQEQPTGDIRAEELIGTAVYGEGDEQIGEIGDVILTSEGEIDAIIVDVGGFLGVGEKEVAIGIDNLQFMSDDAGDLYLYTQFTQEQLETQPAYDEQTYAQQRDEMRMSVE